MSAPWGRSSILPSAGEEVNVALIGYELMGRAHSNAYRQVGPFMASRLAPRLRVLCGRDAEAVARATGRRPRPDFEDGVRNQRVLEAWERSARSRRWEEV